MQNNSQTIALMKLLDDPDNHVFTSIKDKICSYGTPIISELLAKKLNPSTEALTVKRIEALIQTIKFYELRNDLINWKTTNSHNLIDGSLLICKYAFPDINNNEIIDKLDKILDKAQSVLTKDMKPIKKISIINKVLYGDFKLKGNVSNFYDPNNYYLNAVLKQRKGSPIILSIIYSYIAQKLNMPIFGINLPQHFVVGYMEEMPKHPIKDDLKNLKVNFYINPFNKGLIFHAIDIDIYLKQLNIKSKAEYYQPCSNEEIIKRILRSLTGTYESHNEFTKGKELKELMSVL
ncbi:MAG: transglutaminase-like domain-containing protein [Solitalea-like symbiont of Acarus siro]